MSRNPVEGTTALLDAMQTKAEHGDGRDIQYLLLMLLTDTQRSNEGRTALVSVHRSRELLSQLFARPRGEQTVHVALQEMVCKNPRAAEAHPLQRVAQLITPLIWEYHSEHGCVDKQRCPLSPVTQLASLNYVDIEQMFWLPRALDELISTHPYRSSTFRLLETIAGFPLATPGVRSDVAMLLRTVESTGLPEIIGATRHSPWRDVTARFSQGHSLSLNEFHLLRRLGNRLIAAGDTSIIDTHLDLIDRHEPYQ